MPTISEEQLRKAQAAGYTPEQIQNQIRQSQASGMNINIQRATTPQIPTPKPISNVPVAGETMDTSTGVPYVAPILTSPTTPIVPTPQSWDVVGKQKDPTQVSNYLNTQSGFKTTVSGNTVTGTKN